MAERESLNRWQRMSWVSGHGEGWALYAERLMGDLGYLNDPGAYLGMLDSQQLLTAQVPLDIGVHLELDVPKGTGWHEGGRWNAEIAWEILRAHSSWDERQLRSELRRCLGLPGQALPTSGEQIWLQARQDAMAQAGQPSASGLSPGRSAWAWAMTRCAGARASKDAQPSTDRPGRHDVSLPHQHWLRGPLHCPPRRAWCSAGRRGPPQDTAVKTHEQ
jgi:hypothetical protein